MPMARQEKQLAFLANQERFESLSHLPYYWVDCQNCKESKEFRSADGARTFVLKHEGHRTWVQYGGKEGVIAGKGALGPLGPAKDERQYCGQFNPFPPAEGTCVKRNNHDEHGDEWHQDQFGKKWRKV